jgi:hypothetical protein
MVLYATLETAQAGNDISDHEFISQQRSHRFDGLKPDTSAAPRLDRTRASARPRLRQARATIRSEWLSRLRALMGQSRPVSARIEPTNDDFSRRLGPEMPASLTIELEGGEVTEPTPIIRAARSHRCGDLTTSQSRCYPVSTSRSNCKTSTPKLRTGFDRCGRQPNSASCSAQYHD